MPKLIVPPYNKKKTFSAAWAEKKMKEFGCTRVTEDTFKKYPFMKKYFGMPKT